MRVRLHLVLVLFFIVSAGAARAAVSPVAPASAANIEFFEQHVRPLLVDQCYKCHSASSQKAKGGLMLDSREGLLKGGDSGPGIVPGDLDHSLLIKAVRYADKDLQMPPKNPLPPEQVKVLEQWVKMGAPDPRVGGAPPAANPAPFNVTEARKFWSFQPVKDPVLPAVKDGAYCFNPVDAFIRAKQESLKLQPAQLADRRTLIRRVTYDLTGLPPTPEEVEAFVADASPNAYEKVVDRLLASPAYGEKWGRHWLDLVRYADTSGCNSDFPIPSAAKYRDWVIDAFNADKPYDQFLKEQLAGDLLPAKDEQQKFQQTIATGYLAIARRFGSRNSEFYLTIDDVIDNVGKSMLGLTLGCARCHDHKFDPIAATDYYALYGIFASTKFAFPGTEIYPHPKDFIPLAPPDVAQKYREREAELAALDDRYEVLLQQSKPILLAEKEEAKLKAEGKPLPGPKADPVFISHFAMLAAPAGVPRIVPSVPLAYAVATARAAPPPRTYAEIKDEMAGIKLKVRQMELHPMPVDKAYAVCDRPQGSNAHVLKKGDPKTLGDEVPRRFLLVLGGQVLSKDEKGSGRRELAEWIASKDNPLTARVIVNRIWQWHFGKGIVQTPNDFGARGKPATHPELLDYLATRFVENGWSIKQLNKTLVMSHTYQLASEDESEQRQQANAAIDAANDYLSRFNRRRMEAEEIRDSLLVISQTLETGKPGPHPFPPESEWKYTQHKPFVATYDTHHRAVYLMQQRIKKQPFLEVFDGADSNAVTAGRPRETSPVQALFFMNDPLAFESADKFAQRIEKDRQEEDQRIDEAFELCFARHAESEELQVGHDYMRDLRKKLSAANVPPTEQPHAAWASYLRVLLGSNEFFYVD